MSQVQTGRGWGWLIAIVAAVVVVAALRMAITAPPAVTEVPDAVPSHLVVIGLEGRTRPDATDRAVIDRARADGRSVEVGAVSIRSRYLGACAAAGWATLGAGRRVDVGGLCDVRVAGSSVVGFHALQRAAAADWGDSRLGTLAATASSAGGGCVAAVGPGAALAAARPNGTVPEYLSVRNYVAGGYASPCPVTIVDPGRQADAVIAAAARMPDAAVIVTGIGPAAGSTDAALQVIYQLGGQDRSGWLTSPSTRRTGLVILPDLTSTIIDSARRGARLAAAPPMDGAALQTVPARVNADSLSHHMAAIAALSDVPAWMYVELAVAGAAVAVALAVAVRRRRWRQATLLLAATAMCPPAMMLVGATRWWQTGAPLLVLSVAFWVILLGLLAVVLWLAADRRRNSGPNSRGGRLMVLAAAVSAAVFTVEALSGGFAEAGSLLGDATVTAGGRWYGFGNVTFAAYATATILVAGVVAAVLPLRPGRRVPGLWRSLGVLATGLIMVACDGWPTMGADFGGVIAFTPVVLWLAVVVSGLRARWWVYPVIGAGAVLAIAGIAILDWTRPSADRSHLGRFVQQVVAGDATDIIAGKAMGMVHSVFMPLGIVALLLGVLAWFVIFRSVLPRLRPVAGPGDEERPMINRIGVAMLVAAVLGTLLNDSGIAVWTTVTGYFAVFICLDLAQAHTRREPGQASPTRSVNGRTYLPRRSRRTDGGSRCCRGSGANLIQVTYKNAS